MKQDIFGKAIQDFYTTKKDRNIRVISEDFDDDQIPVSYLFRNYKQMPKIEQIALKKVKGKILDVGCGAGCHSIYLNNKGLDITAIDTSKGAVETLKKQGVIQSFCNDFYEHDGKYDTILLLMNGSGIIGKLKNIDRFFTQLRKLLTPNGQVLIDSSDLIYLFENEDGEFWVDLSEGYYGEMSYQMSYNGEICPPFDWLYIDYQTLESAAHANYFNCEVIHSGENYDYLARLSLA